MDKRKGITKIGIAGAVAGTAFILLLAALMALTEGWLYGVAFTSVIPRIWGYLPRTGCIGPLMLWAGAAWIANDRPGLLTAGIVCAAWLLFRPASLKRGDEELYEELYGEGDNTKERAQAEAAAHARDEAVRARRKREEDQIRRIEEHIHRTAREYGISDDMLEAIRTAAGGDRGRVLHTVLRYGDEQRRRAAEKAREDEERRRVREEAERRKAQERKEARRRREEERRREEQARQKRERDRGSGRRRGGDGRGSPGGGNDGGLGWAYGELGVRNGAPMRECRRAYRKRVMETHPDQNPENPNAAREFRRAKAAWDAIRQEHERGRG